MPVIGSRGGNCASAPTTLESIAAPEDIAAQDTDACRPPPHQRSAEPVATRRCGGIKRWLHCNYSCRSRVAGRFSRNIADRACEK